MRKIETVTFSRKLIFASEIFHMKLNRSLVISLVLTVFLSAVYRAMPNRPWGFAPQFAIALFAWSLIC